MISEDEICDIVMELLPGRFTELEGKGSVAFNKIVLSHSCRDKKDVGTTYVMFLGAFQGYDVCLQDNSN